MKLGGDKLTGAVIGAGREIPIQDATYKAGDLSFKVVGEVEGRKMTATLTGKVSGDIITGKVQFDENQSRDWTAKRAKD